MSALRPTRISVNEPFFDGHFPGKPVFPGVLLLEAMAQAAGILGFVTMDKTPADGSIYYFVGADNLRFKRPCVPGDQVMLYASIVSEDAVSGSLRSRLGSMTSWRHRAPFSAPIGDP